jgi:hypothetical protein
MTRLDVGGFGVVNDVQSGGCSPRNLWRFAGHAEDKELKSSTKNQKLDRERKAKAARWEVKHRAESRAKKLLEMMTMNVNCVYMIVALELWCENGVRGLWRLAGSKCRADIWSRTSNEDLILDR